MRAVWSFGAASILSLTLAVCFAMPASARSGRVAPHRRSGVLEAERLGEARDLAGLVLRPVGPLDVTENIPVL